MSTPDTKITVDDLRADPHFRQAAHDGKLDWDGVTEVLAAGKRYHANEHGFGVTATAKVLLEDLRHAAITYTGGVHYGTEAVIREGMGEDEEADCLAGLGGGT